MFSKAYYNEFDPFAAQWLRNLIAAGLIADGDVDERDIRTVQASDLSGYTQVHLFAGIGGWSYALRLSGWPDDEPVWTGSCPCQPFSNAGRAQGVLDERHLWPAFQSLIAECRPSTIFGEQVASKDGREWLAGVRTDLEAMGYAVGAADLCAASVGAKHVRQRLYFVADAGCAFSQRHFTGGNGLPMLQRQKDAKRGHSRVPSWLFDCTNPDSIVAPDGVRRPVGTVRGFGNAIVPQVAAEFIGAFMETRINRE